MGYDLEMVFDGKYPEKIMGQFPSGRPWVMFVEVGMTLKWSQYPHSSTNGNISQPWWFSEEMRTAGV
jgi:hypothetical protein